MSDLGKPVRTWHEVWYADTTCTRYNITTNRYENGQEYDVVDAIKTVDTIPIEWIKKYIAEEGIYPNRELLSVEQADAIERMIENWEAENEID